MYVFTQSEFDVAILVYYQLSFICSDPAHITLTFNIIYVVNCMVLLFHFQCPCIIPKGSKDCIIYDSHSQAATIAEVIIAFNDPTLNPTLSDRVSTMNPVFFSMT